MAKREVELKSCPFCGELASPKVEDGFWSGSIPTGFGWAVICNNDGCNCCGPVKETKVAAIDAWNAEIRKEKVKGEK